MRLPTPSVVGLLVVCSLAGACDDDSATAVASAAGPSPFVNRMDFVAIQPSFVTALAAPQSGCPNAPPFNVPFQLTIGPTGRFPVTLTEVRLDFFDRRGFRAPGFILDSSALRRQFSDITVASFSTAIFPLSFGLGCSTATSGMLNVSVRTVDSSGSSHTSSAQLEVR